MTQNFIFGEIISEAIWIPFYSWVLNIKKKCKKYTSNSVTVREIYILNYVCVLKMTMSCFKLNIEKDKNLWFQYHTTDKTKEGSLCDFQWVDVGVRIYIFYC